MNKFTISGPTKTKPKKINGKEYVYYRVQVVFDKDFESGLPQPKVDKTFKTKEEALEFKRSFSVQKHKADKDTSFYEYLKNEFLTDELERTTLDRSDDRYMTYAHYQDRSGRITRYILAPKKYKSLSECRFRDIKLANLTPVQFRDFFRLLSKNKIGATSRSKLQSDLHFALLRVADRLSMSVTALFEMVETITIPKRRKNVFAWDEVNSAILDESKPIMSRAIVAIELYTLSRPSEIFALKWSDVDLETGTITYNKAMRKVEHGYEVTANSKTGEIGNRSFPMNPTLIELLKALKAQSKGTGYIFRSAKGLPLNNDLWKDAWPRIRTELGLSEGPTFYSLKTLGNSHFQAMGMNPAVLKFMMGHSKQSSMAIENYLVEQPEIATQRIALVEASISRIRTKFVGEKREISGKNVPEGSHKGVTMGLLA